MKRIAIVGGGISGLSAAFTLEQRRRHGAAFEYVLYEASSRLGGVILSERVDGCLLEAGPDSFLTEKSSAADLCRQLGISDQLIGSNDAARRTYVLLKGRLVPIPDGLMFMVPTKILPSIFSPLFSPATKLRMLQELFSKTRNSRSDDASDGDTPDETVASFVARHYGAEMVDRLVDPLLAGVYGGLASQLSMRAVLPRFAEIEQKHGSLTRGMIARRGKATQASTAPVEPIFTTLKGGMQSLVDALAVRLDGSSALRLNSGVQNLRLENDRWTMVSDSESSFFDAIILATPAPAAASLLRAASPQLSSQLASIPYSSSVTVALGFDRNLRSSMPPGFGFLVPRSEGKRILAATFVHNKFPYRVPQGFALIRCFLGGTADDRVLELTDNQILDITRNELREILDLTAEPHFTRVYKCKSTMAQYTVGHLKRLERIERIRHPLPGLALAGNAYRGIGVPDCIRSGIEAADQVLQAAVNPAPLQSHPLS
jgi:protoporphyrinogen/coproporphyrinogen III oxidase